MNHPANREFKPYPDGAIQTVEELNEICQSEDNGVLYKVYDLRRAPARVGHRIQEHSFSRGAHTEIDRYNLLVFVPDGRGEEHYSFCPGDCNIGSHNNDHFLFFDKAKAEAYLDQIRTEIRNAS